MAQCADAGLSQQLFSAREDFCNFYHLLSVIRPIRLFHRAVSRAAGADDHNHRDQHRDSSGHPTVSLTVTVTPTPDPAAFPAGYPEKVSVKSLPRRCGTQRKAPRA